MSIVALFVFYIIGVIAGILFAQWLTGGMGDG